MKLLITVGAALTVLSLGACTEVQRFAPVVDAGADKVKEACVELDRTKCVEEVEAGKWLLEAIVDINGTVLEALAEDSALVD